MTKRKLLHGIANSIAMSFISRNNDINGYWGIGVIYKNASELNTKRIELELISNTSKPDKLDSSFVIRNYKNFLQKQLEIHGFEDSKVIKATIELIFDCPLTEHETLMRKVFGEPVQCKVILIDEQNNLR